MKKLLWLLLLPAVLSGWIMSFNPGFDEWKGASTDSLRYVKYSGIYLLEKASSDLDGGYCLRQMSTSTAGPGNFYIVIIVKNPTVVGFDSVIFYAKRSPNNDKDGMYLYARNLWNTKYYNFSTHQWQTSSSVRSFGTTTSWTRFAYPIHFEQEGIYWASIRRLDNPSSGTDTFYIDSFYVKRTYPVIKEKRTDGLKGLGYDEYIGLWDDFDDYKKEMYEAGINWIRIWVSYHFVLDSLNYSVGYWDGDVTDLVNALTVYRNAGLNILLAEKFPSFYEDKGMRMWDIGGGVMVPYHEDAAFHISKLCQELKENDIDYIENWGFFNEIGDQVDGDDADSVLLLYRILRDTIAVYYPDAKVRMIMGMWSQTDIDAFDAIGVDWIDTLEAASFHIYGDVLDYNNSEYRMQISSTIYKLMSDYYIWPIAFEDIGTPIFIDEYTNDYSPISMKDSVGEWLPHPGVLSYYTPCRYFYHCWFSEVTSCGQITIDGKLHAGYYGFKFIAPYVGKKITQMHVDADYYIVKIEPEIYLISNPLDRDTIEVPLPKAGIAKVRWLDPNTEFPILSSETRSPIYEKTMCINNRLTIPPGYMYAIEYLR